MKDGDVVTDKATGAAVADAAGSDTIAAQTMLQTQIRTLTRSPDREPFARTGQTLRRRPPNVPLPSTVLPRLRGR